MLPEGRPFSAIKDEDLEAMMDLARHAPPGCFVEVGVYQGGSAYCLAEVARERGNTPLYLYDTFTGIPHKSERDSHAIGDFSDTSLEAVRQKIPDAIFGVGVFPDGVSLPSLPISFVHLDVDQYQSHIEAILALWPRMVPGAIMLLDDYNVTSCEGAKAAVHELLGNDCLFGTRDGLGKAFVVKGGNDGLDA